MKSLFESCVCYLSAHIERHASQLAAVPPNCKELFISFWVLEWLCCHERLWPGARPLLADPVFAANISHLQFFSSDQLTDECLRLLCVHNKQLLKINIVHCPNVTDQGIQWVTDTQRRLTSLELRGLKTITGKSLCKVASFALTSVDLSDCANIDSAGLVDLLGRNISISHLYLNNCKSLDDVALYAIASYCGHRLRDLELNYLNNVNEATAAMEHLTRSCPNLLHLSLCKYFGDENGDSSLMQTVQTQIVCPYLKELDLYGNYFMLLPNLPPNIVKLRLSCTGQENTADLTDRLSRMASLQSVNLVITCPDGEDEAGVRTCAFVADVINVIGPKVTGLHIQCEQLKAAALKCIDHECHNLQQLCLDVDTLSSRALFRLLSSDRERAAKIRCLRMCRCNIPWRVLFTIARCCTGLTDLEMSYMYSVDDRFLKLLARNCRRLATINFNGCKWVQDTGLCAVARACPMLREVRVRATSVTDACIYCLAQFCPALEWIAHADYTGTPNFSAAALQTLRDSCVSHVIC